MDKSRHPLLPPPRLERHGEPRAIIEPPLQGLTPPSEREPIDEWESFKSGKADNVLTDDLARRAQAVALSSVRVKRLLAAKRYIAIGASLRQRRDVPKGKVSSIVFVVYNYTDNVTIEVTLDRDAKAVAGVAEARYQPPPVRDEIEQVVALARRDSRLVERLTDEFEAGAIVVSPVDPEDPNYGHRQFDVRFFCPTDRLPSYMALVDLSTERVVSAGAMCSPGSRPYGGT